MLTWERSAWVSESLFLQISMFDTTKSHLGKRYFKRQDGTLEIGKSRNSAEDTSPFKTVKASSIVWEEDVNFRVLEFTPAFI